MQSNGSERVGFEGRVLQNGLHVCPIRGTVGKKTFSYPGV
jgi:hypothetical protein